MALSKFKLTADGQALVDAIKAGKAKGIVRRKGKAYRIDSLTDEQAEELAGKSGTECQYLAPGTAAK